MPWIFDGTPHVLIETLWNVKICPGLAVAILAFVLIETLWNVKQNTGVTKVVAGSVLIETLWNVKTKGVKRLWRIPEY